MSDENDIKKLQEELKKVEVEINEEKTRVVDYASGGSFGFLGFDLREGRNRFGKRFVLRTPMKKKQSDLVRRVGRILKFSRHRKLSDVLEQIRPVIVGWSITSEWATRAERLAGYAL